MIITQTRIFFAFAALLLTVALCLSVFLPVQRASALSFDDQYFDLVRRVVAHSFSISASRYIYLDPFLGTYVLRDVDTGGSFSACVAKTDYSDFLITINSSRVRLGYHSSSGDDVYVSIPRNGSFASSYFDYEFYDVVSGDSYLCSFGSFKVVDWSIPDSLNYNYCYLSGCRVESIDDDLLELQLYVSSVYVPGAVYFVAISFETGFNSNQSLRVIDFYKNVSDSYYDSYVQSACDSAIYSYGIANNTVTESSASYIAGHSAGVIDANNTVTESSASYIAGHSAGVTDANNTLTTTSVSYTAGYSAGVNAAGEYTFGSLLGAVFDAPVNAFMQFFDFEILGVNLTGFLSALFVLTIVVAILRFVLGG